MADATLRDQLACARLALQAPLALLPALLPALGTAFGLALPQAPLTCHAGGDRAALWLGPDEWLLLAEPDLAANLMARLQAACGAAPASLVDVSDRYRGLELIGGAVPALLNEGCPLDLDDAAFPPGACTRSLFGKAEIILWRPDALRWRVEVARSFAPYLTGLLREAARDLGA